MVGEALLTHDGDPVGRASYEFEGFLEPRGRIVSSGQIQMSRADLEAVFGRRGVRLRTDDGRLLNLSFSDRVLGSTIDVANVDVTGDLPDTPMLWRS
jgi:hypothetical protein